jgi:hypothetical protein
MLTNYQISIMLLLEKLSDQEDKSSMVRMALNKNLAEITESFYKKVENDTKIEVGRSLSKFVKLFLVDKLIILML